MIYTDPRIDAFNTAFHAEKYGPTNKGESFETQRQQEIALLKLAYWLVETTFVSPSQKQATVSAMMVYMGFSQASEALISRLMQIFPSLVVE